MPLSFIGASGIELDKLRTAYHFQKPPKGRLTAKQRDVLRLLHASAEPLAVRTIYEAFADIQTSWIDYGPQGLSECLRRLERRGLVRRATAERNGHEPRSFWLVARDEVTAPIDLAEARREQELAALIREQEREMKYRDYVPVPPHVSSLDSEIREGVTLLDVIADREAA